MKRRNFLKSIGLGIASVNCFSCDLSKKKKPNIILLVTDDQRWDTLGAMGNKIIQTPNMDALAKKGVLFTNAFVTTAICCTSRASIFLGQYARRHGILNFSTDFTPEQLDSTYFSLLKNAGYQTGFIGKYGVGRNLPDGSFDYWKGIPGQPKYEHVDKDGKPVHLTKIMGDQALEFLDSASSEKPFCLSISFKAPHVQDSDPRQFIYDPAYEELYKDVTIPKPETGANEYWQKFPEFFTKENEARVRWYKRFATPEMYQRSVKGYYRLITGVDTVVGRIREKLQQVEMENNTVIILVGDNGFYLGDHGMAGKWYGHEESIRVPIVIYDPRLPKNVQGKPRAEIALNIDIAPTMLSLAGLEAPTEMQGSDLYLLIFGATKGWRKDFLYEHLFKHDKIPKSEGVVGGQFKYLRYIEQNPVYEELYDLENDPHETINLADQKEYADQLKKLAQRCDELIAESR